MDSLPREFTPPPCQTVGCFRRCATLIYEIKDGPAFTVQGAIADMFILINELQIERCNTLTEDNGEWHKIGVQPQWGPYILETIERLNMANKIITGYTQNYTFNN